MGIGVHILPFDIFCKLFGSLETHASTHSLYWSALLLSESFLGGVVRVDGPVGAFARVVLRSSHLPEALVEREIVPDGVLWKKT